MKKEKIVKNDWWSSWKPYSLCCNIYMPKVVIHSWSSMSWIRQMFDQQFIGSWLIAYLSHNIETVSYVTSKHWVVLTCQTMLYTQNQLYWGLCDIEVTFNRITHLCSLNMENIKVFVESGRHFAEPSCLSFLTAHFIFLVNAHVRSSVSLASLIFLGKHAYVVTVFKPC